MFNFFPFFAFTQWESVLKPARRPIDMVKIQSIL